MVSKSPKSQVQSQRYRWKDTGGFCQNQGSAKHTAILVHDLNLLVVLHGARSEYRYCTEFNGQKILVVTWMVTGPVTQPVTIFLIFSSVLRAHADSSDQAVWGCWKIWPPSARRSRLFFMQHRRSTCKMMPNSSKKQKTEEKKTSCICSRNLSHPSLYSLY